MAFELETVRVQEPNRDASLPFLETEIATRQTSIDWGDFWGALPDPDPGPAENRPRLEGLR